MDSSLPGSSFHGILQARVLEWVAISFSKGSSRPRVRTQVSGIAGSRFNQGGRFQIMFDQLAWSRSCWKLSSWGKCAPAPPSPCAQQHCPKTRIETVAFGLNIGLPFSLSPISSAGDQTQLGWNPPAWQEKPSFSTPPCPPLTGCQDVCYYIKLLLWQVRKARKWKDYTSLR